MDGPAGSQDACLPLGPGDLHSSFFGAFFFERVFFDFFRCGVDFGRFREAKTEAKIDFSDIFCDVDFGWIFGGSKPEKSMKTDVLLIFTKSDVFEKSAKIP